MPELNLSEEDLDFEERLQLSPIRWSSYAFEDAIVRRSWTPWSIGNSWSCISRTCRGLPVKEDLVRVKWSRSVPPKWTDCRARKWFESDDPEDLHELELWMAEQGSRRPIPEGQWMSRERLDMELPFNGSGVEGPAAGWS